MKPQTSLTKKDVIFTLCCVVFLLVNLAAIGNSGRKRAKEAVCLSNLRQWGLMFQMYTADNNGFFGTSGSRANEKWKNWLRPYHSNDPSLLLCPEATISWKELGWMGVGDLPPQGAFYAWEDTKKLAPKDVTRFDYWGDIGSYGANSWAVDAYGIGLERYWKTINVAGADIVPLLLDCTHVGGRPDSMDAPPPFPGIWYGTPALGTPGWTGPPAMSRFCINRHDEKVNSLFFDLSARAVGLKELWTLKWYRTYDQCGQWTTCGGVTPEQWPEWMRGFKDY